MKRPAALTIVVSLLRVAGFGFDMSAIDRDASAAEDTAIDGPFLPDPPLARWRIRAAFSG